MAIRFSVPADRDAILAFIARMGFNPRDAVTWDGLNMLAACAWVGDRLIGVVPLEPRVLCINAHQTMRTVHETVVAIDPEYRGGGIGSQLQELIFRQPPMNAELVTVFREEPQSPAYQWYLKNGFLKAMEIDSWFCDDPAAIADPVLPCVWQVNDPAIPWNEVEHAWVHSATSSAGGKVDRSTRNLRSWLSVHPYRKRYEFQILRDARGSFALLGIGTMHSETIRADVLELMPVSDDLDASQALIGAIAATAARNGWRPLRVPLSRSDPRVALVTALNFRSGWSFDMLARPMGKSALPGDSLATWRYAGVDYI